MFLCSGGGGNLRFINQTIMNGWFDNLTIAAVLTDRECGASQYARINGIHEECIDFSEPNQSKLVEALALYQPDIVITTVHRILHKHVIEKFGGRLVNLHYSLLPAFGGLIGSKSVKEAISYGAQFTGATVHFVDETLDGGKPVVQVAVPLREMENADNVMDIVFRCGCISLGVAIESFLYNENTIYDFEKNILKVKDRYCMFSKSINLPQEIHDEEFWKMLKTFRF
jgi:phosphoribosylglycinamide formyltransferase 1